MTFVLIDALLSILSLSIVVATSIAVGYSTVALAPYSGTPLTITVAAACLASVFLVSSAELWIIRAFVPLIEGRHSLRGSVLGVAWKLQGFLYVFNLGLIINTGMVPVNLRWVVFRILGAKIGQFVMIGGKLLEPPMIEIGDFTILGADTLVIGHAVEDGTVYLGKVVIGRNVTVGVNSVIMPDVRIGDGSVVGAMSLVTKGTRIGPHELWHGIPAKKVRDLIG